MLRPGHIPCRVLLRHHLRTGAPESLEMSLLTLPEMSRGGICDHVGGGFARYGSRNGLVIGSFAATGFARHESRYLLAAEQAADYILRHERTPAGRMLRSALARPLLKVLRGTFMPHKAVLPVQEGAADELAALSPLARDKVARGGRPTAHVCTRGRCRRPTTDPKVLRKELLAKGGSAGSP